MRIGAYFDGFAHGGGMVGSAKAAEQAGLSSLWFAQHMGYREAYISAAFAAVGTNRIKLIPTAVTPYLSPPMSAAMSIATLAELAPGRVELAVSIGNLLNLAESGFVPEKPVAVLREYVAALRALLAGETVHSKGVLHSLKGAHMEFLKGVEIPIHIASTGPRMLELAGKLGDGALLSAGLSMPSLQECLDHVGIGLQRSGRDPATLQRTSFVLFHVSEDGLDAEVRLLKQLAYMFRSRGHADNIRLSGVPVDHDAIIAAYSRQDVEQAITLVPPEAASVFGIAGTPKQCRVRLEEYETFGLDELVVGLSGDPVADGLTLELLREHIGRPG